ncbi:hypothetical protein CONPUDRAFT_75628 [Coniophora puteana RWD-64-598 SS2]|uniref:Uncharacterized protein n=1 Tax=Coniophora puteana (strain RWD-64-598) TaxID=741705 RepID=A0A5M3MFN2_CONPW|nr:uncharacterized protein CONPUDRAFT_75628 [Coniophora puteana RWD-64-598 SS2]EIW77847.1 hypothetical protein CONPUDRAFT_75628 [Coniophora puteana RWD-64-598 SS2]
MTSIAIVDDRSASIQYSGNWVPGGTSFEYDTTTTGSNSTGDTATFTFTGTWVSVYGTTGSTSTNGIPTIQFTVDGGAPVLFTAPNVSVQALYHYQTFASDVLDDTTHTLVIKNTSPGCPPALCTAWIDFIEYIPSQASCMIIVSFIRSSSSDKVWGTASTSVPSSSPSSPATSSSGTASHTSNVALAAGIGGKGVRDYSWLMYDLASEDIAEMAARTYQPIITEHQASEVSSSSAGRLQTAIERLPRRKG